MTTSERKIIENTGNNFGVDFFVFEQAFSCFRIIDSRGNSFTHQNPLIDSSLVYSLSHSSIDYSNDQSRIRLKLENKIEWAIEKDEDVTDDDVQDIKLYFSSISSQ